MCCDLVEQRQRQCEPGPVAMVTSDARLLAWRYGESFALTSAIGSRLSARFRPGLPAPRRGSDVDRDEASTALLRTAIVMP